MKKSARAAVLAACMILTLAGCTAKAPGTTPAVREVLLPGGISIRFILRRAAP